MPEQPDECYKHHMMLKKELDEFKKQFDDMIANCEKMRCFFFGGMDQIDGHLSFVDKVNSLYKAQQENKDALFKFLSIFGALLITGFTWLVIQLHKIDTTAENLANVVQKQQTIQIDLEKIKTRIEK